jgi:hypothetical protein
VGADLEEEGAEGETSNNRTQPPEPLGWTGGELLSESTDFYIRRLLAIAGLSFSVGHISYKDTKFLI